MDIGQLAQIHHDLAERIKRYEQRTGESPPVEVLDEIRYGFRAALELLEERDRSDAADGLAFIRRTAVRQIVQHDVQRRERERRKDFWVKIGLAVGMIGGTLTAVGLLV